jgi:hypothetical protein
MEQATITSCKKKRALTKKSPLSYPNLGLGMILREKWDKYFRVGTKIGHLG